MTKDQIRTIFMQRGFTIKEGQDDLKEYVYEAANDLIRAVRQEIAASAPNTSAEPVANEKILNAPDRIYLVCGDLEDIDDPVLFRNLDEVTWCEDQINETDIEYVRADAAPIANPSDKQEAVCWAAYNGVCLQAFFKSEEAANRYAAEMQKNHDLSGSLAAFSVKPLYAAPLAQSAEQDRIDAERYRYLRDAVGVILDCSHTGPWKFGAAVDTQCDEWLARKAAIAKGASK